MLCVRLAAAVSRAKCNSFVDAVQVLGLKAYADCPAEMPDSLKPFKHAKDKWHGTDDGAYDTWVLNRPFQPLTAQ